MHSFTHLLICSVCLRCDCSAQDALREVLKATGAIVRLLGFVRAHPEGAIRQIASSVLRFRITVHMIKFSPEDQEAIKQSLLEALVNEPLRTVRNSVAGTIAQLAKSMVANNQGWPQLPQVRAQTIANQKTRKRTASDFSFVWALRS